MKNHQTLANIELKEKAILEELTKIKNRVISEGRKPTKKEEQEIQELREHLNNYTEIKKVWLESQNDDG